MSPRTRQVDIHDATDFADEYQAELFETSSKSGENIGINITIAIMCLFLKVLGEFCAYQLSTICAHFHDYFPWWLF